MKELHHVSKEDITTLLGRSSPAGVLSVHVGSSSSEPNDPQRWLSAVRSGLKELGQKKPGEKALPLMLETALGEISGLPLEARHRSLVYYRSLQPDWTYLRSVQMYLPDYFEFDSAPQVRHLLAMLDEAPLLGVAVVSQEKTRLLTWREGMVEELASIGAEEQEPSAHASPSLSMGTSSPSNGANGRSGVPENRAADRIRRRMVQVAHRLWDTAVTRGWQRLLLIGSAASTESVAANLPEPGRRLLIGQLDRNLIHAPTVELGGVAAQQLHRWKRHSEVKEVEDLLSDARSGRRACVGMDVCLDRLFERQVERLYVRGDLSLSGFRDIHGRLYARSPQPPDDHDYQAEPRLVERMLVAAIESGASVIPLEGESAGMLGLSGGVGARLRWKNLAGQPAAASL